MHQSGSGQWARPATAPGTPFLHASTREAVAQYTHDSGFAPPPASVASVPVISIPRGGSSQGQQRGSLRAATPNTNPKRFRPHASFATLLAGASEGCHTLSNQPGAHVPAPAFSSTPSFDPIIHGPEDKYCRCDAQHTSHTSWHRLPLVLPAAVWPTPLPLLS